MRHSGNNLWTECTRRTNTGVHNKVSPASV